VIARNRSFGALDHQRRDLQSIKLSYLTEDRVASTIRLRHGRAGGQEGSSQEDGQHHGGAAACSRRRHCRNSSLFFVLSQCNLYTCMCCFLFVCGLSCLPVDDSALASFSCGLYIQGGWC
jgi:hypothetical protein